MSAADVTLLDLVEKNREHALRGKTVTIRHFVRRNDAPLRATLFLVSSIAITVTLEDGVTTRTILSRHIAKLEMDDDTEVITVYTMG